MIALATIGTLEAVVYLLRYRSAHSPSAVWSACTTGMTASLRIAFVIAGVRELFSDTSPWQLVLAYAVPATLATWGVHAWLERRKAEATA